MGDFTDEMLRGYKRMTLKELCKKSHEIAVEKGFWGKDGKLDRNVSELLMLCVSELGEACEALRKNNRQGHCNYCNNKSIAKSQKLFCPVCRGKWNIWRKDTFEDEICDTFIRLGDLCESLGINIEWQIKQKWAYNKKRPLKHGKEF